MAYTWDGTEELSHALQTLARRSVRAGQFRGGRLAGGGLSSWAELFQRLIKMKPKEKGALR